MHLVYVGLQDTSSEISQDQIDERAFQEVQKYADFQRELSERVYDDILKEGTYGYPRSSLDTSVFPSICHNFLPAPIIIPQQRSEGGKRAWTRAYAPSLLGCGIDQDTFLDFLDSYNQVTKVSHSASSSVTKLIEFYLELSVPWRCQSSRIMGEAYPKHDTNIGFQGDSYGCESSKNATIRGAVSRIVSFGWSELMYLRTHYRF